LALCSDAEWGPEALGEPQSEAIEQGGLGSVRTDDAANAQFTCRVAGNGEHDIRALDSVKLVEDRSRTIAEPSALLPLLERLP
jgi:hypothetical protein